MGHYKLLNGKFHFFRKITEETRLSARAGVEGTPRVGLLVQPRYYLNRAPLSCSPQVGIISKKGSKRISLMRRVKITNLKYIESISHMPFTVILKF